MKPVTGDHFVVPFEPWRVSFLSCLAGLWRVYKGNL